MRFVIFQVQVGNLLHRLKYCSFLNSHKNLRIGKHLSQRKQTLKKQFFIGFVDRTLDGVSFYAKKKRSRRNEEASGGARFTFIASKKHFVLLHKQAQNFSKEQMKNVCGFVDLRPTFG